MARTCRKWNKQQEDDVGRLVHCKSGHNDLGMHYLGVGSATTGKFKMDSFAIVP
ncbi:hypothetical protein WN943_016681 [Citrus x changshan-huyou]